MAGWSVDAEASVLTRFLEQRAFVDFDLAVGADPGCWTGTVVSSRACLRANARVQARIAGA